MNAKLDTGVTTRPVTRDTFDEVLVPTYAPAAMVPVRASGLDLWDQSGKHYLDFTSGIAVTSLGHCNPVITDALTRQLNTVWHLGNGYTNEPVLRLGAAELMKGDTPPRVAIQEAVRLAERFGTSASAKFVNGVLDAFARQAGMI